MASRCGPPWDFPHAIVKLVHTSCSLEPCSANVTARLCVSSCVCVDSSADMSRHVCMCVLCVVCTCVRGSVYLSSGFYVCMFLDVVACLLVCTGFSRSTLAQVVVTGGTLFCPIQTWGHWKCPVRRMQMLSWCVHEQRVRCTHRMMGLPSQPATFSGLLAHPRAKPGQRVCSHVPASRRVPASHHVQASRHVPASRRPRDRRQSSLPPMRAQILRQSPCHAPLTQLALPSQELPKLRLLG